MLTKLNLTLLAGMHSKRVIVVGSADMRSYSKTEGKK